MEAADNMLVIIISIVVVIVVILIIIVSIALILLIRKRKRTKKAEEKLAPDLQTIDVSALEQTEVIQNGNATEPPQVVEEPETPVPVENGLKQPFQHEPEVKGIRI